MVGNKLKGFPLSFNIYASSEGEVEEARKAIIDFINENAQCGRAVTASKLAYAIRKWKDNAIVRTQVINYFKG